MTVEQTFWNWYEANRAQWHRTFMEALLASKLPSYANYPKEQLLPALGKSMDLLIQALRDRDMEAYVAVQRANFRARVKAGIAKEDLLGGQKIGSSVLEAMVTAATTGDDRRVLLGRAQRMMMLTTTALTEILFEKT